MKSINRQDIIHIDSCKLVKDLERINKIKTDLRKGEKHYYDGGIKPENRCRDDEYPYSN